MALNSSYGLGFVFTARDLASARLQRLERSFQNLDERVTGSTERMKTAFTQLGVGLGVFVGGAAVSAGTLSLANAAGKFEQGLAAVGAVSRATSQELDLLRNSAIQAGINTQFSPDEAVSGLQSLATAGQTATQATKTLIPVLDLAAGSLGQIGVSQAADAVVGTLNAYGMAAEKASGVTDKLLRVTQLTNFQTRDFEAGLSKAAATGSVFGQTLDDVLITMGLLRNRNIDASSSATAFREAVRRVGAENRAMQAVQGAGVKVFDKQTGRMRSIVDIIDDFAKATDKMTQAERNNRVVTAFGARGLLAFNAVLNATHTVMRDGVQVTLQGAEAIASLRAEMGRAEGTAQRFREKLADTFEGQKTLLKGTLQTFAIVLGEPFAAVFKPIVMTVVGSLNVLLRVFQAIPAPVKVALAGMATAFGALLMFVGAAIAAKGAIVLFTIAMKALGITIGGIMAVLLPAILVASLLGAAVAGLVVAFRNDVGGIGDAAFRAWERVTLLFRGIKQLMESGELSGAVQQELAHADNKGIKRFVISVYQSVYRLGRVWQGFKDGFVGALQGASPIFEQLRDAFGELGQAVMALLSSFSSVPNALPSNAFYSFGQAVGKAAGALVNVLTWAFTVAVRVASGIVGGFRWIARIVSASFAVVADTIAELSSSFSALFSLSDKSVGVVDIIATALHYLARVVGVVIAAIVSALALVAAGIIKTVEVCIRGVVGAKEIFLAAGQGLGAFAAVLIQTWDEVGRAFSLLWERIEGVLRGGLTRMRGFFRPVTEFFVELGPSIRQAFVQALDSVIGLLRKVPDVFVPTTLEWVKQMPLSADAGYQNDARPAQQIAAPTVHPRAADQEPRPDATMASMPAVAQVTGQTRQLVRLEEKLIAGVENNATYPGRSEPISINVQVDGETIARAVHRADAETAARSFSPVAAY